MKRLLPLILFCSALLVIVIQGCAAHDVRPVQMAAVIPSDFQSSNGADAGPFSGAPWWHSFDDAVLDLLMEQTFAGNLDLAQGAARLQQALALSRQRRADGLPAVDLQASAGRSRQVNAMGETEGHSRSFSLAAGYEVDLWGKIASRKRSQALEADATRQDLHAVYLTLSAQVAENYYFMVEQRARLELIDQTIAARQDNLELVALRYGEGMVSALDLYQARQNLANAKSQRPDVEANLATAAHSLAVLTGGYPAIDIGGDLNRLPDVPDAFPLGLPSDVLQHRPDIQAAMLRLASGDLQVAAAVADRFPSINLVADYGRSETDFGTVISGTVWNLIGNLTLPLIDFHRRKAEVDRNEAAYDQLLAAYRQAVLVAFQEVEDALVANRQAGISISRIIDETAAAEDALRLSKSRYTDGLSDYLPVLTAQAAFFDSRTRLLIAQRRQISARISLARALGGNWMAGLAHERLQAGSKKQSVNKKVN